MVTFYFLGPAHFREFMKPDVDKTIDLNHWNKLAG
jgi:hypothetical protein